MANWKDQGSFQEMAWSIFLYTYIVTDGRMAITLQIENFVTTVSLPICAGPELKKELVAPYRKM